MEDVSEPDSAVAWALFHRIAQASCSFRVLSLMSPRRGQRAVRMVKNNSELSGAAGERGGKKSRCATRRCARNRTRCWCAGEDEDSSARLQQQHWAGTPLRLQPPLELWNPLAAYVNPGGAQVWTEPVCVCAIDRVHKHQLRRGLPDRVGVSPRLLRVTLCCHRSIDLGHDIRRWVDQTVALISEQDCEVLEPGDSCRSLERNRDETIRRAGAGECGHICHSREYYGWGSAATRTAHQLGWILVPSPLGVPPSSIRNGSSMGRCKRERNIQI